MSKLSAGKYWGMRRLADDAGRWKMIAIDQRGPLMAPIAQKRGVSQAPFGDLARVKSLVTRHLSPHATAMLLDPNYAYGVCINEMPAHTGLCLALEHHITRDQGGARLSDCIPDWSVEKIRRVGADAVKLLVWYRPDAPRAVVEQQQAFVRSIGQQCREHDIVLLLELLVYPMASDALGYLAAQRNQLVINSLRDFAAPEFGVDIYKLEPPASVSGVPDPQGAQASAVQALFDDMARHCPKPWVLLSAGASAADFNNSLVYAYRAGASGYLCGRAIWQSAFECFPDFEAMDRGLATDSVRFVHAINELTDRLATPWTRHAAYADGPALAQPAENFASQYQPG
jgi:tagatose 1,6-diphosphate aldolase